ncbi:hypothetical protein [Psychrobacillus sp. NPDC096623]|uniref:hypothetical protein n=1 Tax=Psychrobacillus sp. NPDC096623 TaxID=3364492 RepID=UPI00382031D3
MLKKSEIPIFEKEFKRLSMDYERCTDASIKNIIKQDILLITKVLEIKRFL